MVQFKKSEKSSPEVENEELRLRVEALEAEIAAIRAAQEVIANGT